MTHGATLTLSSADIDERAARVSLQEWSGVAVGLLRSLPKSVPQFSRAFSYRGYSTWELAEAAIHWDVLEDAIPRIQAVDELLGEHHPSSVGYFDDGSASAQCIVAGCAACGIPANPRLPSSSAMVRKHASSIFTHAKKLAFSLLRHTALPSRGLPPFHPAHADVVLLSYGSVHGPTLAPVYEGLRAAGVSCQVIDFYRPLDSAGRKAFERKGIPFTDLWKYVTPEGVARVRAFQKELSRAWPSLRVDAQVNSRFSYRGVPLFPLIDSWMDYLVFSRKRFAEIAFFIEAAEEVMRRHNPSVILSVDDISALGRAFADVANRQERKSVCVQHGVMRVCPIFSPVHSSLMAVWGSFYKDEFVRVGVPGSKLAVTGIPRWDSVISRIQGNAFDSSAIRKELSLPRHKKLLLWASQKYLENKDEISQAILQAGSVLARKDVFLLIKPHPEERSLGYRINAVRAGCPAQVMTGDIYPLLCACDAVITGTSTAAIDALLFEKPVVSVNLSGKRDRLTWSEQGAAIGVYRPPDVLPALEAVLFDPTVISRLKTSGKAFLHAQANGLDGRATERQVQLIRLLLS